jgi:hypothetical protein
VLLGQNLCYCLVNNWCILPLCSLLLHAEFIPTTTATATATATTSRAV